MVELNILPDCGNSPRKQFLKDLNIAFAQGNVGFFADYLHDDAVWEMVGDKVISGKAAMLAELTALKDSPVAKLVVRSIITHGPEGAVNGEMHMTSGDVYAFCDVYRFTGASGTRIKSITSYAIALPPQ